MGGAIEYVVTLTTVNDVQVDVRCVGKVLRMEPSPEMATPTYVVAATMDRYQFIRRQAGERAEAASPVN